MTMPKRSSTQPTNAPATQAQNQGNPIVHQFIASASVVLPVGPAPVNAQPQIFVSQIVQPAQEEEHKQRDNNPAV